jgi:hypothetical protein
MKKSLRYGIIGLMVAGVSISISPDSHARSFPAFLGQPQSPFDYQCFTNSGGAVFNNCSTTRQFCTALPVDSTFHQIEITVRAPDINHNVSCFGVASNRDGSTSGFTGVLSPSVFGSSQVLTFITLMVPPAGGLYACCNVAPTALIQSFNYNN